MVFSTLKNKFLIFSSYIPPVNAGAEKNAFNFALYLARNNYKTTLLSFKRSYEDRKNIHISQQNLRLLLLPYHNRNLLQKFFSGIFILIPRYFVNILKSEIIFIYGAHFIGWEIIVISAALLGKKVIFRSTMLGRDDILTLTGKGCTGFIRKQILRRISLYFSINPVFTMKWFETFPGNTRVLETPQGIDTEKFSPVESFNKMNLREKLNLPKDSFIILSVGYVEERKGYREIYHQLVKLKIPFLYIVVGDYQVKHNHYKAIQNQEMLDLYTIGKRKLKERIRFTGPKENTHEYYKAADCFLINSRQEGLPNVILEAMSTGLPVCTYNLPGIEGYLITHNQNGMIFNHDDEIHEIITALYLNPEKRSSMGKKAREQILGTCSFDRIIEKLSATIL